MKHHGIQGSLAGLLLRSACLFAGSVAWSAATASVYYVATDGSDSSPGTEAQPWRTIQKAATVLVAGDTVRIRAGTYHERVVPLSSGSAGSPIVYSIYPGETVTVDGTGVDIPEWAALVDLAGLSYVRVSGLRVVNARANPHNPGILADGSSHVVIERCFVSSTNDSGIAAWSSTDVVIDHNEVEHACLAGWNECISAGGTVGFEISNNLVHHSTKEGICAKDGSSSGKVFGNEVHHTDAVGFYVDAQDKPTHHIEVYGNVSHDGAEDGFAVASEVGGLLSEVDLYNNVAYRNGWVGIDVTACCVATHPISGVRIVNNTLHDNGLAGWGGGILIQNPQTTGIVVRNNITSQNLTFQVAVDPGVPPAATTVDHNLIDGFRGEPGEVRGADHVEGDPMFQDAAAHDFRLRAGSPAIGKGNALGAPATDFAGTLRGSPPDIGAYEHSGASGCTPGATTLCIDGAQAADRRFEVQVDWQTVQGGGQSGKGTAVSTAPIGFSRGGIFWFFEATNPEMLVKVLNGCGVNGSFWVFASAGTNVGMSVRVTDTQTGTLRAYVNPDLTAAPPVQDVQAFPCP